MVFLGICYLEVEPLVVPFRVDVVLQNEVVGIDRVALILVLVHKKKIAAFEVRVENDWSVVVLDRLGVGLWPDLGEATLD